MVRISGFCLVTAAMSFLHNASAAGDVDAQAVQATALYAKQHLFAERLVKLGIEEDKKLGLQTGCHSDYSAAPLPIQVLSPAEFVAQKADPVKGTWLVRYRLSRCGESKVYNALFVAKDGDVPAIGSFYPGSTLANVKLIKDAMVPALIQGAAASTKKNCTSPYVFDMQVARAPANRTWNEVWTFSACGELIDVPMTFVASEDGSSVNFNSGKAMVRPTPPDVKP